ncbi:MAG: M56 family metallopeptidase [Oscillospiraceae bacterium]
MEGVFIRLLNMSIAASWLILAVIVLRFLLKNAPKNIRRILWALVGIRLVFPFSPESFLSLIPSVETVSPDILYAETPKIHSGISAFNTYVNPVISESLAPAADASINPMQVVAYIASIVWIIGMITLILYSVISYVRLRRRVADAVILRDNSWQSEKVDSPFVLGLFRPRIYLPFGMDDESLAYVVAHEQAHIKRRDHWIKPIGFLLLTVYCFNPLIWLAYILLCRDIELACDERVVKELGAEDKKAYSKALLTCSIDRRSIAACPLAFGEVGVKQRVKNVLNYKKPAFWIIIAALASCIVVAVCFLTNPKTGEDPAKVVGEYDTSSLGGAFATSGNSAYKIGMNAYGMPVFADMDAAFDAILEDCAEGFAYLSNEFSLPAVTKQNYEAYKAYGWQTGASNEAVRKQCVEISQFFDIYENSFSTDRAVVTASTADGNGTYTAGAFLGQNGGLSYLPEDGGYYAQIILSNYSLSVINDEGQTIFENGRSKVSRMTRAALIDKLSEANVFGMDEADVPEYDSLNDMMVYSYYALDGDENDIKYSIYWFNGEPQWFAEDEMLRIYVLEPTTPTISYISQSCLYMNPLSSTFSDGDSDCRYLIGEDSLTVMNKQTGEVIAVSSPASWEWQEISEEEWATLFPLGIGAPDIGIYKNPQVMKLSSKYYLFNMDGELWFGDFHGDKVGIWSVYSLVQESTAGVTWEYAPALSSRVPAFPFRFNLAYTRIEAECTGGHLIGFDDYDGTGYPQGKTLTFPAGSALYWSPTAADADPAIALTARISFTVYNGDEAVCMGAVSISGTSGTGAASGIYNAVLSQGDDLMLIQSPDTDGALIQSAGTYPASSVRGIGWPQHLAVAQADLDGDGADESITVTKKADDLYALSVLKANGSELWSEEMSTAHTSWDSLFLCTLDGKDYLLRYNPTMFQGECSYRYTLFTLENGQEYAKRMGMVEFDVNGTNLLDVDEMTSFADKVNALLEKSTLLLKTEGGITAIGPSSADEYLENYVVLFASGASNLTEAAIIRAAQVFIRQETDFDTIWNFTSPELNEIDASRFAGMPLFTEDYDADGKLYEVIFNTSDDAVLGPIILFVDNNGTVFGSPGRD